MLDVLQVPVQQILHEVLLHVLHRERLEVVTFDVVRLQLLQVRLQIVVEDLRSHFALQASPLVEVIIYLLLEVNEALVLARRLQLHQVLRDQLLRVDMVEELLVSDQVPRGLLGVLQLAELDNENVLQLLEVLLHIIDSDAPRALELDLLDLGVEVGTQGVDLLLKLFELAVALVHEELVVEEGGLVVVHVLGEVALGVSGVSVDPADLLKDASLVVFVHMLVFLQLRGQQVDLLLDVLKCLDPVLEHGVTLLYGLPEALMLLLRQVLSRLLLFLLQTNNNRMR